jgi:hypothetical protein
VIPSGRGRRSCPPGTPCSASAWSRRTSSSRRYGVSTPVDASVMGSPTSTEWYCGNPSAPRTSSTRNHYGCERQAIRRHPDPTTTTTSTFGGSRPGAISSAKRADYRRFPGGSRIDAVERYSALQWMVLLRRRCAGPSPESRPNLIAARTSSWTLRSGRRGCRRCILVLTV